jgi:hypothetical protein
MEDGRMTTMFPLTWPEGWPRTKNRMDSRFKTTLAAALKNLEGELRRFGADSGKPISGVVISSNYTLGSQKPADPGVAVYFTWDNLPTCIAVDRYGRLEENLQAIFRCLEAERTKLRHGGLNVVRSAFRGYAALPPPGTQDDPWTVLGIKPTKEVEEIKRARNKLAGDLHPDRGGSDDAMARINAAFDRAMKEARA